MGFTLPLLSTLPPLTTPLSTLLPTPLPRCTPMRSPPTSTSTPLPTTTPAPTSRLPRLTTALLPGLDLTPSPSLTAVPSTLNTLPTMSRDTSLLLPTTARLSTLRLSLLPTLLPTPLPTPSTLPLLSMPPTLLQPLWSTMDKLRVDQEKTFIDMLTSILFMIFIHKSIND